MHDEVVAIYLHATLPPSVFQTTRLELLVQANDLAAQEQSGPGGGRVRDFPAAWELLTRDKRAAYCYQDVQCARDHVAQSRQFTLHERTLLLSLLDRLEGNAVASAVMPSR